MTAFARSYAQAFLQTAPKDYDVDRFLEGAATLRDALGEDARLKAFFSSPAVPLAAKYGALAQLASKAGVDAFGTRLLDLALAHGRALGSSQILSAIREQSDRASGVVAARVTVAAPVDEAERGADRRRARALGQAPCPAHGGRGREDPGRLRGEVGSEVFDASVRNAVERFQQANEGEREGLMQIKADEITEILKQQLAGYEKAIDVAEVGTVLSVGDGIARVYGLDNAMSGELLDFGHDLFGLALNLEEDNVGVVLLGESREVIEGQQVRRTGRIIQVPVGTAMVGRVVDALGRPLDGKGPIATTEFYPLERHRARRHRPAPVREPIQTGLKAIDAHDPDRPRPARAHHRRPPDGQDRARDRHDHQPEGEGR